MNREKTLPGLRTISAGLLLIGLTSRLAEASIMGATAAAAALLIRNLVRFGALAPVSCLAQTLSAPFAGNLVEVPSKLFEYATLLAPIPRRP